MTATRRLAAILAADVAGYSRLMGADEEGTLERLKSPTSIAAYDAGWPRVPDRGSLSCRAILDGTTVHIRDMDAEPGVSPEIRALGYIIVRVVRGTVPAGD